VALDRVSTAVDAHRPQTGRSTWFPGVAACVSAPAIPLVVPPGQLTLIVVLASIAGVLAAVGPARRAAKLDILDAIASH
jgi:ABC-type antimicrobial peptide transport system permease subunit